MDSKIHRTKVVKGILGEKNLCPVKSAQIQCGGSKTKCNCKCKFNGEKTKDIDIREQ